MKKNHIIFLFFVSFLFVTLFSRATSFLYVFEGADPSVFKQMGLALLKGKLLYIDYFDNKGCLLYFLHALALRLGGDFFLMLFQTISLFFTMLMWSMMLDLYHNARIRNLCLGITLVLLLGFYCSGDQSQEWCLPFITYPLLVYFKSYKTKNDIRPIQMLLIGVCVGIITFIQVNNACVVLGFYGFLWLHFLLKKEFRRFFTSLAYFILGWLLVASPCVMYFYLVSGWHGVYEMVYASFLSNLEYIGAGFHIRLFLFIPYVIMLLSLTILTWVNSRNEKEVLIPVLLSIVIFALTFGKLGNMYYLMAILPLFVITMMTFNFVEHKKLKRVVCGIMAACLLYYLCDPMLHFGNDLLLRKEKELVIYDQFHHCIEKIPENERDSIYNYNLYSIGTSMMHHESLLQSNRVLFTSLGFTLPTLKKEEAEKPFIPPKWILLTTDKYIEPNDAKYIESNYVIAYSFQYDKLYFPKPKIGELLQVYLLKRIEE